MLSVGMFNSQVNKGTTCPHGYAMGACPVCGPNKQLAGGGGGDTKKTMSYADGYSYLIRAEGNKIENQVWQQMLDNRTAHLASLSAKPALVRFFQNNPVFAPLFSVFMRVQNSMVNAVNKIRTVVNQTLQRFGNVFNMMEKLAALYGEIEKDIKDKLSDTFKKIKVKLFGLLEMINAGMGQQENEKEKKIKNRLYKNKIGKMNTYYYLIMGSLESGFDFMTTSLNNIHENFSGIITKHQKKFKSFFKKLKTT